jgi:hypothetical protein
VRRVRKVPPCGAGAGARSGADAGARAPHPHVVRTAGKNSHQCFAATVINSATVFVSSLFCLGFPVVHKPAQPVRYGSPWESDRQRGSILTWTRGNSPMSCGDSCFNRHKRERFPQISDSATRSAMRRDQRAGIRRKGSIVTAAENSAICSTSPTDHSVKCSTASRTGKTAATSRPTKPTQ